MANNTPTNFFDNTLDIVNMYVTKEYIINNYANILPFVKTPQLWCWGTINTANNAQYTTPIVHPTYSTGWQQLSGLQSTILGIKSDGTMWAWGTGVGPFFSQSTLITYNIPNMLGSKSDWVKVSTSSSISCGIDSSGTLYSWGSTSYIGRSGDAYSQLSVTTTNKITNVSVGFMSFAFIDENSKLFTTGQNNYGQIGNGITNTYVSTPYTVTNTDNTSWLSVSCGKYNMFAIDSNYALWAWGNNQNGVMGAQRPSVVLTPVKINTTLNFKKVCASNSGNSVIGAIDENGKLWMWGDNAYGQLGNGTYGSTPITTPALVNNDTNWCSVYCSDDHTVAIKTDGTLWGWGKNNLGQVGVGSTVARILPPTRLGTGTSWKDICILTGATLGLLESGGW